MATYFWPITLPIILAEFCDPYAGRATLKDWKHQFLGSLVRKRKRYFRLLKK